MKTKLHPIFIVFLAIAVVSLMSIAVKSFAVNDNQNQNQNQQQTQNQGEDQQIQTQTQEGIEDVDNPEDSETGDEDEGDEQLQERTREQLKEQAKAVNGEEHRSTVANFVQTLLNVADREKGGIGEQVKVVAQEQERVQEKVADQIESIQKRNKIKTFLIGTNYKNIGALRSEMVQVRNRIEQLNRLMEQAENQEDKTSLQEQIQTMEQEAANIDAYLKVNESKFSLFGWLVKLFVK
jgi:hypothetical protein